MTPQKDEMYASLYRKYVGPRLKTFYLSHCPEKATEEHVQATITKYHMRQSLMWQKIRAKYPDDIEIGAAGGSQLWLLKVVVLFVILAYIYGKVKGVL